MGDVTMPAPNAAALGKYSDIPVSHFTGVPSIGVDIYTVEEGPLSLPISLSYHASGVKVAETASWVGLGWSLNAGGIITRTVQGLPDDGNNGYLDVGTTLVLPLQPDSLSQAQQYLVTQGQLDSELDLFSFNVGGMSGKFFIDKNHNVHFVPKADYKITFDRDNRNLIRFTLVGTDGTKYVFGNLPEDTEFRKGLEFTLYDNIPVASITPSSWYLRRVISSDGNYQINLDYVADYFNYRSLASCSYQYAPSTGPGGPSSCGSVSIGQNTGIINNNTEGWRLTNITTSTCAVEFHANTAREDLDVYRGSSGFRLDSVTVRSSTNTDYCMTYRMAYTYLQANVCIESQGTTPVLYNNSELKRLQLNSVQKFSCDGTISEGANTFEYNTGELPPRLSKAIDHWGYYNGACANEKTLNIPPNEEAVWLEQIVNVPAFTANRDPNEILMKYGSIEKINYPTGGSTTFTFGANEIKKLIESEPTESTLFPISLSNCTIPFKSTCCSNENASVEKTFTTTELNNKPNTFIRIQLIRPNDLIEDGNPNSCMPTDQSSVQVFVKITGQTQNFGSVGFNTDVCTNGNCTLEVPLSAMENFGTFEPNVSYTFTMVAINGKGEFNIFKPNTTTLSYINEVVGGLRIETIRQHDGINAIRDIVTQYDYSESEQSTLSSAFLYQSPKYWGFQNNSGTNQPSGLTFFATSVTPLANFNGYTVGYQRVVTSSTGNGKTEYFHHVEFDSTFDPAQSYPYSPDIARVRDGNVKAVKTYKESDANIPIQIAENQILNESYEYLTDHIIYKGYGYPVYRPDNTFLGDAIYIKSYQVRTAPFRMQTIINTLDNVTTTTSYTYDPTNQHLQPITETTTNSDGTQYRTGKKYVFDQPGGAYQDMIAKNIIAQPILVSQEAIRNGVVSFLGDTELFYQRFDQNTGLLNNSSADSHPRLSYLEEFQITWDANGQSVEQVSLEQTINSYHPRGTAGAGYVQQATQKAGNRCTTTGSTAS
ncbi:MAG: hypothetical protein HC892_09115 [Saprospiraceae bacterium]|nr:hypothetical protein [Saprospiraceae bacterium]